MRYIVINENTLGYIDPSWPWSGWIGVLAGSLIKGGRNWKDGPTVIGSTDVVRDATVTDFELFRVSPKGHLT